jgi:hypothetical protein
VVVASSMKSLVLAEGELLGPARSRTTRTEQRPASFGSAIGLAFPDSGGPCYPASFSDAVVS